MSYQVLARKWRPRIFREMVGQEHVLKALINALDHNRLHHAYLFTGTRGVGKTTIARILAKCLNCETGVSSEPCGTCSACVEISEGRFVDLIEVDAASRTKVEDTRELLDNVQYAPTRGRYKIYLIDEVHMLSSHSFNALLKTLEEPPEHVKFLLATTDPQKLPVTILSRCLQFNLKNMSPERIVGHLQGILDQEVIPFEEAALWLLARSADGSMRDALSLTDQAISHGGGKVVEHDVASMLGTIDHKLIQELMDGLICQNGESILTAVAHFAEHAPDYSAALADLLALLHRVAIAQALPEAVDNSYGDRREVLDFAQRLTPEDVQLFYQIALMGRRDLPLAADQRSGFEMALLRMLAFKPQGVVDVPSRVLGDKAAHVKESSQVLAPSSGDQPRENNARAEEGAAPVKKYSADAAAVDLPARSEQPEDIAVARDSQYVARQHLKDQVRAIVGKEGLTANLKERENSRPETAEHSDKPLPSNAVSAVVLEDFIPTHWITVYHQLKIKGILQSTAANCVMLGREGNQIYFALDETKGSLFDGSHTERLAGLLSDYFGQTVKVHIHLQALPQDADGSETPAEHDAREKKARRAEAIAKLYSDPVVQTLQEEFQGALNEESVTYK